VINPEPLIVSPELAEAALSCVALDRARRLAAWIGTGRELTSSGVLRPALAQQACRELGIELPPGKLRSALDVPELMQDWEAAFFAEFIEVGAKRVRAADDLPDVGPATARRVLRGWLWAVCGVLGLPDEPPCPGCLTVLHELSLSGRHGASVANLAVAVRAVSPQSEPAPVSGQVCEDCGRVHDVPALGFLLGATDEDGSGSAAEHVRAAVDWMMAFGAVDAAGDSGTAHLTPLGRMLAESLLAACSTIPGDSAAALIAMAGILPPKIARHVSVPWLSARSEADAVRELLAYAEFADPDQRMAALAIAREQGREGAAAWRERAEQPGFGAYARAWLAEHGEPVAKNADDEAWLAVEAVSLAGAVLPEELTPLAFGALTQDAAPDDMAEMLLQMSQSGHPDAGRVIWMLSGGEPQPGAMGLELEDDDVYQLKITLRGVSKPPVWRRVLVPAGLTLDKVHEVILLAMGWHGGHLHVFSDGRQEYGDPDPKFELGHRDETRAALRDVLSDPAQTLTYTYDFGDDWVHKIKLEKILPAGSASLTCLAGGGACPPDDCGGAWGYAGLKEIVADPDDEEHEEMLEWLCLDDPSGFDPALFSVDDVNARLKRVRLG
jgi:hypothetical protein